MHERRGPRLRRGAVLVGAAFAALALPALARAETFHVQVGGTVPGIEEADLQDYYPSTSQVHVGDQVSFDFAGFHTVTFPPGAARPRDITPFSLVIPTGGGTYPVTNDAAGNPFWWGGVVPMLGFNPDLVAPTGGTTVDGSSLVGSGFPAGPSFTVTFSQAGSFAFYCAIHPRMRGMVKVLPASKPGQSAEQQAARAQKQIERQQQAVRELDEHVDSIPSTSSRVLVGPGTRHFTLLGFYPETVQAHVGETVRFRWDGENEVHTVTFGSQELIDQLRGSLFGPVFDPVGALPSEPPASGVPTLTQDTHGNGFLNSGLLPDNSPGDGPTWSVRFGQAGSYHFECLIHPTMRGDVVVS